MKVFKNYLFNASYQLLVIILPLITIPYVTRIFTPEQIGINAYTFSVSQYFVLFAGLGVGIYGNRTIAYVKSDERKIIKNFWSIFFAVLITSTISLIVYLVFILFIIKKNTSIYIVQSLYIFAIAIDISWLFMAMEDFRKIVTRNTIVKLIGVVCIFIFVKSDKDLVLYILILALTNLLGVASMWLYLNQYIKSFDFDLQMIRKHFIPLIRIYIPQLAIQVYVIMDKTMLGTLSSQSEVGYYDMSQKIVKILLTLLTSLGVVMIPHISSLLAAKKYKEVEKTIGLTFTYISYFSFPMAFGLSTISKGLTEWFFGSEYAQTGILMSFSAFIIIAISWSNIIGNQLLLPMMKEKEFTISVVCGAFINIIINLFLIPILGAFGAIIATIVAEFIVTLVQIVLVKKYINVIPHIVKCWKSLLASIIMLVTVYLTTNRLPLKITTTFLQIFIGLVTYFLGMWGLRSEIQRDIIGKVFKFFIKNS